MKLPISQLLEGENVLNYQSTGDSWLNEVVADIKKEGYELAGKLELNVRLTKLEPDYYMRGELKCQVNQTCARCAETFVLKVHQPFELALVHVVGKTQEAKLAEESEELDINYFTGNELNLTPIALEQFFLSIPFKPLCETTCRGLCQQCGKNLNQASCDCKNIEDFHPFSVLKGVEVK